MSKFEGIYAATVSVLNNDLSLNIDKTINHAETIIDNGCHGAAIFGSTGQAQLLSISEKINLLNKSKKLIKSIENINAIKEIKKTTIKKKYVPHSKEKYMCAKHKKFFTWSVN